MTPEHARWLDQVREEILLPDLVICDPHHHLWDTRNDDTYLVDELHADTGSGHRVVKTVYVDCASGYRTDGPEAMRPMGEIEFAAEQARESVKRGGAEIAGIVGHADLLLGDAVEEVLVAQIAAGDGRFRGIRHATAADPHPAIKGNHVNTPLGAMSTNEFRDGMAVLGEMDLTFDAWLFHPQLGELAATARAVPGVTIVLDHLGGPIGIGPYTDHRAVMEEWRRSIADVATCPNVVLKLGGIGMAVFGNGWHKRPSPPTSEDLVAAWGDDLKYAIEQFGPQRCMFESNFPVDAKGCSYAVLWNAFKRVAAAYTDAERQWLFHDTAATVYKLGLPA
jgi:predicted TIM-barrel fold metal-dependent hydrolase